MATHPLGSLRLKCFETTLLLGSRPSIHADANMDRGTHFLVGSGIAKRGRLVGGRLVRETVGSGDSEMKDEGSHRSVLIS